MAKNNITNVTLKFVFKEAWQKKPIIFFVYFLQLIAVVLERFQFVVLPKFVIDQIENIINGADLNTALRLTVIYIALTIGLHFFTSVLNGIVNQIKDVYREWFNLDWAAQIGNQSMKMDFQLTEEPEALNQKGKADEGSAWYSGSVVGILDNFFVILQNCIVFLGVILVIVLTCPILIPILILSLVIIAFFNYKNNKIQIESFSLLSKINRIFGYYFFNLSNYRYGKDLRLYDCKEMFYSKSLELVDEQVGNYKNVANKVLKNNIPISLINVIRDGLVYSYIGYQTIIGKLSVGNFTMCINSANALYTSLQNIVLGIQEVIKRCNYANEFLKYIEYPQALSNGTVECKKTDDYVIEFKNVFFKYPRSEDYVLKDINLKIEKGEHLAIVGLNGAGKTTFIKLLCRLYDVTSGEILINGRNITEYKQDEYRNIIATVFQDFKLFAFSLKENICFTKEFNQQQFEKALLQSGISNDVEKFPNGYDTMISKDFDEEGIELSGGQQQKTAIARAIYKDSPIIILDEPTAALDPLAESEIYSNFNSMVGGKTAIYISHRLSSCKFCDKIAVFNEGKISEYGNHQSLMKQNALYKKMFDEQAQGYAESK